MKGSRVSVSLTLALALTALLVPMGRAFAEPNRPEFRAEVDPARQARLIALQRAYRSEDPKVRAEMDTFLVKHPELKQFLESGDPGKTPLKLVDEAASVYAEIYGSRGEGTKNAHAKVVETMRNLKDADAAVYKI